MNLADLTPPIMPGYISIINTDGVKVAFHPTGMTVCTQSSYYTDPYNNILFHGPRVKLTSEHFEHLMLEQCTETHEFIEKGELWAIIPIRPGSTVLGHTDFILIWWKMSQANTARRLELPIPPTVLIFRPILHRLDPVTITRDGVTVVIDPETMTATTPEHTYTQPFEVAHDPDNQIGPSLRGVSREDLQILVRYECTRIHQQQVNDRLRLRTDFLEFPNAMNVRSIIWRPRAHTTRALNF